MSKTDNTDTTVKKSVVRERQRIADKVIQLVESYGYRTQAEQAWREIFPGLELRDSRGRTLSDVR